MRKRWVRYTAIPRQTPPNNKAFPRDPVAPSRFTNLELDHLVASSLQLSDQARLRLAQRQHFLLQRLEQGAVVLPSYFVRAHHGFVRSHHGEAGGELVPPQGRRKVFGEKNKLHTHTRGGPSAWNGTLLLTLRRVFQHELEASLLYIVCTLSLFATMSVAFNSGPAGLPLARIIATFFAARSARPASPARAVSSMSTSSSSLPYGLWRGREGALDITSAHNSKVKFMRYASPS